MIFKNKKLGLTIIICAIVGFAIGYETDSIGKGVVVVGIVGIIIGNIMRRKKQLQ